MYGYIYLTENLVDYKVYIGKHQSEIFDEKYIGSGKVLLQAISKYGIENFVCTIIEWCETEEDLNKAEYYWINKCNAVEDRMFYNLKIGGTGGGMKHHVSLTNGEISKYIHVDDVEKQKELLELGWVYGRPKQSEEWKTARANSNRGKKRSAETRNKISKALTSKHLKRIISENIRKKLSETAKYRNKKAMKKVRCIETGEIFISIGEAARKYNTCTSSISHQIKGKNKTAGGHTWEFID